jgi:hypothetical protein
MASDRLLQALTDSYKLLQVPKGSTRFLQISTVQVSKDPTESSKFLPVLLVPNVSTGCNRFLKVPICFLYVPLGCCSLVQSAASFCRPLQFSAGCCRFLQKAVVIYRLLQFSTGRRRFLLAAVSRLLQVAPVFCLPDFVGFYRLLQVSM